MVRTSKLTIHRVAAQFGASSDTEARSSPGQSVFKMRDIVFSDLAIGNPHAIKCRSSTRIKGIRLTVVDELFSPPLTHLASNAYAMDRRSPTRIARTGACTFLL